MKSKLKTIAFILLICLFTTTLYAQVAINTTGNSPDASAMLDVVSDSLGLLIPRMTTTQRLDINVGLGGPAEGLLVYDLTLGSFFLRGNGAWINLSSSAEIWSQIGLNVYLSNSTDFVGIGTNTPTSKLDVRGESPAHGGTISLSNSDQSHMLRMSGGTSTFPDPYIQWKEGDNLRFVTNQGGWSEKMRITTWGSIGIGTAQPATYTKFHVLQSGSTLSSQYVGTVACFQSNGGPDYWSRVSIIGGIAGASVLDLGDVDNQQAGRISYEHMDNFMAFHTDDTEKMRISSSGDVGIGTTTPGVKLEVASGNIAVYDTYAVRFNGSPDGNWQIYRNSTADFTKSLVSSSSLNINAYNNTNEGFAIGAAGGDSYYEILGSGPTHFFRGDVGIGTAFPSWKLDVNGDVNFTGDLYQNGALTNVSYFTNDAGYITSEIDPSVPTGTQTGEMQFWNGSAWITVQTGKEGQVLTFTGGIPTWTTPIGATDVYNPTTGKIWMDRNLGALQVATSISDADARGDLYQWGRGTDGHEKRTSATTATLSSSDTPGHGYFITNANDPYDWRSPQNDNLWQGVGGTNNPCPSNYRLPTEAEWNAERLSWNPGNISGAFNSPLKLVPAGNRSNSGSVNNVGSDGLYWSSTLNGIFTRAIRIQNAIVFGSKARAEGMTVRCIKD